MEIYHYPAYPAIITERILFWSLETENSQCYIDIFIRESKVNQMKNMAKLKSQGLERTISLVEGIN